jgi:hypothetical protein
MTLRRTAKYLLWGLLLSCSPAESAEAILPNGRSVISEMMDGQSVGVELITHTVDIGTPTSVRHSAAAANCTFSRFPCSVLDSLALSLDGYKMFVPRSAFCGVSDLRTAALVHHDKRFVLIMQGADASEAYILKIAFDKSGVHTRVLFAASEPAMPLETTQYHSKNNSED